MTGDPIYLDGLSTNPLAPEALAAMTAAWARPGNPASPHRDGASAARMVARARQQVADLIGAAPSEIIFTSGATEANNLAIVGAARAATARGDGRRRVAVSAIEHKSVLDAALALRGEGFEVDILGVDATGRVDPQALQRGITADTLLVSVMAANNETGVFQSVQDIGRIAHAAGALMHCDAAQAAGKVAIDVLDWDVDYLSLSAHKLYGPLGVGALYIAAGAPALAPLTHGGGQQKGVRPGTEPAPLLVGFGAAAALAAARLDEDQVHGQALADRFMRALAERQVRFKLTTGQARTLAGSLSLALVGVIGDDLVQRVAAKVSISTGSACTSGQVLTSHVLRAMNIDDANAQSVIRVFCGRYTSEAEIDLAAAEIAAAVEKFRVALGEVHQ